MKKYFILIFMLLLSANIALAKESDLIDLLIDDKSLMVIGIVVIVLFLLVFLLFQLAVKWLEALKPKEQRDENEEETILGWKYISFSPLVALILIAAWFYLKQIGLQAHMFEWLNLLVRWVHVIIGIAWIGASFYFNFLENALNRTEDLRDELAGNLWAVHGGGFYYLEKYKLAPKVLPKKLHWFKYEAYFTWITGFGLLFIVYYFNADVYLIDSTVADISTATGIAIGLSVLIIPWFIYDALCKSKLAQNKPLFALIGFLLTVLVAFLLSQVFSSRAAYMHVGAMLGTLMAWNVFFVIIPGQKAMVQAAKDGTKLNPQWGKNAGLRSLHNNYMTLPVVFIMISNHFPSTYGNGLSWIVLAGLFLASALLRHYFNLIDQGQKAVWILPLGTLIILTLAFVTAPSNSKKTEFEGEVSFLKVMEIVNKRCNTCHSANPTDDVWVIAPNGVTFDTPEQIVKRASDIMTRAVVTKTMPQGNKTKITEEERAMLGKWIEEGAKIE